MLVWTQPSDLRCQTEVLGKEGSFFLSLPALQDAGCRSPGTRSPGYGAVATRDGAGCLLLGPHQEVGPSGYSQPGHSGNPPLSPGGASRFQKQGRRLPGLGLRRARPSRQRDRGPERAPVGDAEILAAQRSRSRGALPVGDRACTLLCRAPLEKKKNFPLRFLCPHAPSPGGGQGTVRKQLGQNSVQTPGPHQILQGSGRWLCMRCAPSRCQWELFEYLTGK